eukprot:4901038-Prorocentrum_lima.AAC.1
MPINSSVARVSSPPKNCQATPPEPLAPGLGGNLLADGACAPGSPQGVALRMLLMGHLCWAGAVA